MNTCNSANSVKLGKLLKSFKLTPKNKQNNPRGSKGLFKLV